MNTSGDPMIDYNLYREIYEVTKYTKDSILRNDIILSTKDVLLNHYRITPAKLHKPIPLQVLAIHTW